MIERREVGDWMTFLCRSEAMSAARGLRKRVSNNPGPPRTPCVYVCVHKLEGKGKGGKGKEATGDLEKDVLDEHAQGAQRVFSSAAGLLQA